MISLYVCGFVITWATVVWNVSVANHRLGKIQQALEEMNRREKYEGLQ